MEVKIYIKSEESVIEALDRFKEAFLHHGLIDLNIWEDKYVLRSVTSELNMAQTEEDLKEFYDEVFQCYMLNGQAHFGALDAMNMRSEFLKSRDKKAEVLASGTS